MEDNDVSDAMDVAVTKTQPPAVVYPFSQHSWYLHVFLFISLYFPCMFMCHPFLFLSPLYAVMHETY